MSELESRIAEFNAAFSQERLDDVMGFFADECEFRELGGNVARGQDEVRSAVAEVFSGSYGRLTFEGERTIVDPNTREVCFVWTCRHDLGAARPSTARGWLVWAMLRLVYGRRFHWEGADFFSFDEELKITSKRSYGRSKMPLFLRTPASDLGPDHG